jgi:probable HAF family extracellular repeat protein
MFTIGAPFGLPSEPSTECVGSVQTDQHYIDFPGSVETRARGLNNQSAVVGDYVDQQNHTRGFIWKNGSFAGIDFPGAILTSPSKINDSGDVVGSFRDATGRQHGFLYANGKWTQIDYPGARATVALGIGSSGQIVGHFIDPTALVFRGFILTNGHFTSIDTPFGVHASLTAINDAGSYVGSTWNDLINGPYFGFINENNEFSILNMPGAHFTEGESVNNSGAVAGNFDNGDGYSSGFVRLFGYLHEVNVNGEATYVYGNNNLNQIAGDAYDFNTQRWVGYIGDLPITKSK